MKTGKYSSVFLRSLLPPSPMQSTGIILRMC